MPLAVRKPLTNEEKKLMVLVVAEMQTRGMKIPEIPQEALSKKSVRWPLDERGYFLSRDGKRYNPNDEQAKFTACKARFSIFFGGRGSGKSCSGSQKAMKKIMQGQSGAVLNADFENFKYSTWPEFKKWIPWEMVVPSQRGRESDAWQPTQPFVMSFLNGVRVYCKGLKDPDSARGPNINWLWYDESGRDETGMAWKLAIASVRVGDNPQAWCTQTAKTPSHWSYKLFVEKQIPEDALVAFGVMGKNVDDFIQWFHSSTDENKDNLDPGFYASLLATYQKGAMRERELGGRYVEDGGAIGNSGAIQKIKAIPEEWKLGRSARYWDMAATEKKLGKNPNDPDEAVGTLVQECFAKDMEGKPITNYVIMSQVGGYFAWEKLKTTIRDVALDDGPYTIVVIEQEPASGGKNQVAEFQIYFRDNPDFPELRRFVVTGQRPTDRVIEATSWFGAAEEGRVFMIEDSSWNRQLTEQVDTFPLASHDDRVTSCSGVMRYLFPKFKKWKSQSFITLG
jgi:phage terminase large subunit-like protein